MKRLLLTAAMLLSLAGVVACDDQCCDEGQRGTRALPPTAPTPVPPTTPAPLAHRFEFRVLGSAPGQIDIRYGTTQIGTTIVTSQLPWFIELRSLSETSFLTLQARFPDGAIAEEPLILHAQILVDGVIFREASVVSFDPAVSISGLFIEE